MPLVQSTDRNPAHDSSPYQDEEKFDEDLPLFELGNDTVPSSRVKRRFNIWIATSFILGMLLILQSWLIWKALPQYRTYDRGFSTDLEATWGEFDLVKIKFTGGLYYNESGNLAMTPPPLGEPNYVGPASHEIDMAWSALIFDSFGAVPPHLVDRIDKSYITIPNPETGLIEGGLDAMHSLHCVDMFRMSLDTEYYQKKGRLMTGISLRLHMEHCVNQLRQAIMCHGDATFMPLYWEERANRMMPFFDTTHTCRNFQSLRRWTDSNVDGNDSKYAEQPHSHS